MGILFILSWGNVWRVALRSIVSVWCMLGGLVFVICCVDDTPVQAVLCVLDVWYLLYQALQSCCFSLFYCLSALCFVVHVMGVFSYLCFCWWMVCYMYWWVDCFPIENCCVVGFVGNLCLASNKSLCLSIPSISWMDWYRR